ncbi:DNA repair protein RecO [Flavobacterium aciduliphilum]|uniref:DNA repair protein RecO n=1 Tax=Flavobacterium aciduliphilum TaxID=1101402 RepID=A0A328YBF1_9FLAO|nr:DNA repair protein RecO [Flavobacterium aciduliphilum]RAR71269.1 DNA replication and repair protein RecO [Flavobacterium aciduliphilum]
MLVKTKALVLSSQKYQEKSLIVKCFTATDGIKSYFVPNAFSGKKNQQKKAYFQPLTLLELEANHKNKGTLEYFKEIKLATPYYSIHTDITKSTIVLFLSEIIAHSIHEEEKNQDLFTFFETALLWLDSHDEAFNFHLITLLQLTKFLGFYPEDSQIDACFFDVKEGVFTSHANQHTFSESETTLLKKLIALKFDSPQKTFTGVERHQVLNLLLHYYTLHLEGFQKPKSLDVLKEVFS